MTRERTGEIKSFREEEKISLFRVSEFFFSDSRFLFLFFQFCNNTQKRRRERETKFLMR